MRAFLTHKPKFIVFLEYEYIQGVPKKLLFFV